MNGLRAGASACLIVAVLAGCAALGDVLDYPLRFFDEEGEEVVEASTTVGAVIADSSDAAGTVVTGLLSGVNPALGVAGGALAAALVATARRNRKKKAEEGEGGA